MSTVERIDWRNLPPIPEEDRPPLPETFSQSILARQAVCPRSALLYHRHRGGAGSLEMDRGSAFHEFARLATLELVDQNEPTMPPEVARDLMQSVMDRPEFVISPAEADRLRVAAYHFAVGFTIDPERVLAVETMVELDLGWIRLRGKVDLAYAPDEGTIAVEDYKTSMAVPSQADFEGLWQVPFYAVLLAYGKPTTEYPCEECKGAKQQLQDPVPLEVGPGAVIRMSPPCATCGGKGSVWKADAFPLGDRAQYFRLAQVYPMLEPRDGRMFARDVTVSRSELADHRAYVEGVAGKLRHAFETGDFPAIRGSHCETCAAKHECPLPAAMRGAGGAIESAEDAEETAVRLHTLDGEAKAARADLRAYAKAEGVTVPFGDLEWRFETVESEKWRTGKGIGRPDAEAAREAMVAAIDRAKEFGEPFDYGEYRVSAPSSKFVCKKRGSA